MKCPHCDVALLMTERKGIEIDYCSQCRGVWLDRGELDKIIDLSTAERTVSPREKQPQYKEKRTKYSQYRERESYSHDGAGDGYYKKGKPYRKKGIMHQIFDIFD